MRLPQSKRPHPRTGAQRAFSAVAFALLLCFARPWHSGSSVFAVPGRRRALLAHGALLLPAAAAQAEQVKYVWEVTTPTPTVSVNVSKSAPPLPSWAAEFDAYPAPGQEGPEPVIRWEPVGPKASTAYPAWLAGRWRVKYLKQMPQFPAGFTVMATSLSAGGVDRGSILRLPDVNRDDVQAEWRFVAENGQVRADWSFMLPSIFTAFVDKGEVVSIREAQTVDGPGLEMTYRAPSGFFGTSVEERTPTVAWLAADSWEDPERGSFLSVEWQRQRVEASGINLVYDYKILTTLRRLREDRAVGIVRAAAFVQPTEGSYAEAAGRPAGVYEYQVYLDREA